MQGNAIAVDTYACDGFKANLAQLDTLRHHLEQLVTGTAVQRVVDIAKTLDVDQHHRSRIFAGIARAQQLADVFQKQRAVGQACGFVVVGQIVQPLFLVQVVQRETNVACQFNQQNHFLIIEKAGFAGIQGQHAHRVVQYHDGQICGRQDAACQQGIREFGFGLCAYIVTDQYFFLPNGTHRHAVVDRQFLGQGETVFDQTQIVRIGATGRNVLNGHGLRIDQANARHFELALFHGNAARLAEQLVTVVHAHNQCVDAAEHGVDAIQATDFSIGFLAVCNIVAYAGDAGNVASYGAQNRGGPAYQSTLARACQYFVFEVPSFVSIVDQ